MIIEFKGVRQNLLRNVILLLTRVFVVNLQVQVSKFESFDLLECFFGSNIAGHIQGVLLE